MAKLIFVNLPVTDLPRSAAFYEAVGAAKNPQFSDDTAACVRAAGCEAIERHDLTARGKGYALAFGRDHLAAGAPPDAVVILDADCRLLPGSIEALAREALARGAPVQAVNLVMEHSVDARVLQVLQAKMAVILAQLGADVRVVTTARSAHELPTRPEIQSEAASRISPENRL